MTAGHIRRRGERSWELKFDAGRDPATGRRKTRYVAFKGTKAEAKIELAKLVAAAATGGSIDPSKMTVSEFIDRWERDWMAGNVSPKTGERYAEILRKHVRPRIGSRHLQKVVPATLADLYATLQREGRGEGKGLAARTVGHVHRVLHRALGHAMLWGLVQQNVAAVVSPPKVQDEEIQILADGDVQTVLKKLRGRPIYPLAAVALATGMRRGELLALRWQDLELDRRLLRVERALETTKAGLRFKAPKTRHGRRAITLPSAIVEELRAIRKTAQEQWLSAGMGKLAPDALVFGSWDGAPRHPDGITKEWSRAMATIGMRHVTLHSLRHTHASQLIASGLDVLTISRRLGHGSPAITLRVYGHLFTNTDDRAAQAIEATFRAAGTD